MNRKKSLSAKHPTTSHPPVVRSYHVPHPLMKALPVPDMPTEQLEKILAEVRQSRFHYCHADGVPIPKNGWRFGPDDRIYCLDHMIKRFGSHGYDPIPLTEEYKKAIKAWNRAKVVSEYTVKRREGESVIQWFIRTNKKV